MNSKLQKSSEQPNAFCQPMPADRWLAYLQAMDVTPWVAKENLTMWRQAVLQAQTPQQTEFAVPPVDHGEDSQEAVPQEAASEAGKIGKDGASFANEGVSTKAYSPDFSEPNPDDSEQANQQGNLSEMAESSGDRAEAPVNLPDTSGQKPLWVKPVSWRSPDGQSVYGESLQGEQVSLRVICRHSADQPAASFASKNGPSRFMLDYLQALQMALQPSFQVRTQLFHLAEAGLSEHCQPLSENLYVGGAESPAAERGRQIIWLMGESAVTSLLGDTTVAASRLCLHQSAYGPQPIICSYHPFDLISHPAVKKLVLEDFQFLKTCLGQ